MTQNNMTNFSYQIIEDVSLMNVNSDEGLEFGSLVFCQFFCRDFDEGIKDSLKISVGSRHYFFVQLTERQTERQHELRMASKGLCVP